MKRMFKVLCSIVLLFAIFLGIVCIPAENSLIAVNVSAVERKLSAPKNIKSSVTQTTITLKWDKVSGADAYMVYIFNSETDEYENYKTVNDTTCTAKGLASNTTYKFKVAALVENKGKYSVQTKSDKIVVKTSSSKKNGNTLTKRKKPGEFKQPWKGDSIEDVLTNSGIANWKDVGTDGVYAYMGTVLFSGIESQLFLGFNEDKKLTYYGLSIPVAYSYYSGFRDSLLEEFGADYKVSYDDDKVKYSWKISNVSISLWYDFENKEMDLSTFFG